MYNTLIIILTKKKIKKKKKKKYKEGVNEVIQNYAKPYKDRILSVLFPLHF